jgi:hypothetical protein
MERVIKRTEPTVAGMKGENGSGFAIRSLPGNKQFWSRACVRCEGLLVRDWILDLQNPGNHQVESLRCVQCGNCVDPVILQNQLRLSGSRQSKRQVRHTRIAPLSNVAEPTIAGQRF